MGHARAAAVNAGRFPFPTTDCDLKRAAQVASQTGNLEAVTDEAAFGEADVIVVDVGLDIDDKGDRPTFKIAPFRAALEAVARHMRPKALVLLESTVPPGPVSASRPRCCGQGSSRAACRATAYSSPIATSA